MTAAATERAQAGKEAAGNGHRVVARSEVPVRRSVYDNGTVSRDWIETLDSEEEVPVRVTFSANGKIRVYLRNHHVAVDRVQHGDSWGTTIELVRV
jgi:hypothetical protein